MRRHLSCNTKVDPCWIFVILFLIVCQYSLADIFCFRDLISHCWGMNLHHKNLKHIYKYNLPSYELVSWPSSCSSSSSKTLCFELFLDGLNTWSCLLCVCVENQRKPKNTLLLWEEYNIPMLLIILCQKSMFLIIVAKSFGTRHINVLSLGSSTPKTQAGWW